MAGLTMAKLGIDKQLSAEEEDGASVWAFLWVLFAFKLLTTALIFWYMRTWIAGFVLGANTWYWFPVMGAMAAAPLLLRRRLRRQRARRLELLRSEWMVPPETDDESLAAMVQDGRFRG
ncbi:MAG: hypothetical protein ACKOWF_13805 [Chloroflexota bacterium]